LYLECGKASVEIKSIILEGNPAIDILDSAVRNDIDLIVMVIWKNLTPKSSNRKFIRKCS